nr:porin [uncultured Flavobacterium sp.]
MKKIYWLLALAFVPTIFIGQVNKTDDLERQTNEGNHLYTDSIRSLIPIAKQSLLRDVDVIFNSRMAFNSNFRDGNHLLSNFNVDQLRFEIKGKIHEKVYFRFRNRYTREPIPGNLDNISRAVDLAFIRVDLSKTTKFSLGKLCADWGGYEFDYNPIDILTYNDIIENADNFLVGAGISHDISAKHSLSFQVLNSRTKTYGEQYGPSAPPNIEPSKFPLAGVINWRGSFFDGKFETTYSFSYFNEAKQAHMNYFALGNKFKPNDKFVLFYDFHYSKEQLDRKGIISGIIDSQYQFAAQDALYVESWVRAEYLVTPKVNLLLTVMNSNHSWKANPDSSAPSKLSTSYGIIPTVQYAPFMNVDLKFYIAYTGRKFNYTNYAENTFGVKDYTTGLLAFGFVGPLLVL